MAMEEPPFLIPMQGIVRGVQIQPDFRRRRTQRLHERIRQQPIHRLRVGHNPLIAAVRRAVRFA